MQLEIFDAWITNAVAILDLQGIPTTLAGALTVNHANGFWTATLTHS
ncbi:hypothetical protein Bhyg_14630 [Pseudolycoriella hygida]|uniref:Uncharacterized protein n=1 Tax=Pseudolycoriella hygida TaxID=35572 RepID=A0A9Q0RXN7_9DIPT|nr:hypothetical protein Bhyg_14630 [Pseudolycoriella hygida]